MYDTKLKQVKQIKMNDIRVNDVCDMLNGEFLIAATNGLYHTKSNGK